MADPLPVLRVGLTGGIASGKSTVARMFAEQGAHVIDADELAHAVTEPGGAAYRGVVARFGREILEPSGRIDRRRLGLIVFHDEAARRDLETLVHPAVRAECEHRIAERQRTGDPPPVALFDAALLVESGAWREFDRLVVVRCRRATQIRRLRKRDGMSRAEAEARIRAQAPLDQKTALADHVIDTEGSLDDTRRQVVDVYARLLAAARRRDRIDR